MNHTCTIRPFISRLFPVFALALVSYLSVAEADTGKVPPELPELVRLAPGWTGELVKVVAWYDNETGYANRLVELIERFA